VDVLDGGYSTSTILWSGVGSMGYSSFMIIPSSI